VDRVRNFYNYSLNIGNKLVNKIIVNGDHPWTAEICRRLAQQIDIPIEIMNCPSIVANTGEPIDPSFYLNIGLGLKEVE
jgi:type IV pilus assembly protein PilM